MIRNLAIGLVAGAVAVAALVFARPRMLPAHPFNPAVVKIDSLAPLPGETRAWEMGVPPTTLPASRPTTRPGPNPLDRVVDELKLDAVPLSRALDALGAKLNANIVANWKTIEAAGVEKQTPRTLNVRQVPGRKALDVLFSGDLAVASLGYRWQDDIVVISTREELDRYTLTRLYDIRDLMMEGWRFSRRFPTDPASLSPAFSSMTSGTGPIGSTLGAAATESDVAQQISTVIETNVHRESWLNNGGMCTLKYWAGRLVITQTPENHEKVEAVLRMLRGQAQ